MKTDTQTNVVEAYASRFTPHTIVDTRRITDGSINETFEITTADEEKFIVQRMAPIFPPSVMDNLSLVEPYVVKAGVAIPHGVKTVVGDSYVVNGGGTWYRALTYIPGKTIHDSISVAGAKSAGQLVGRFHSALADCQAELAEAIPHFHDTAFYLRKMQRIADNCVDEAKRSSLGPIVREIAERAQDLALDVTTFPQRIIHADLKVSNVRFGERDEAVGLIDMDTMMRGSIVTEMGDALRSWCGTAGEDDANQVFDVDICKAALEGYASTANGITEREVKAIPDGIRLLALELAARFVTDAYEETYFAKSSLYPSLYEQCKTKAENQLRFLKAFEAKQSLL